MENFKVPARVEWSNRLVLTTAQLADNYGCRPRNISDNFNRAKEYFEEGVHYFKLEGKVLRTFREYSEKIGLVLSTNTPALYLWTYQGCVRHCKMINTSKAWEVFDALEKFYFEQTATLAAPAAPIESDSVPAAEPAPALPARKCHDLIPDCVFVYIFLMANGTVKIGYSNNPMRRAGEIERSVKIKVAKVDFTPPMSREYARLIEWAFKKNHDSQRIEGEFFSVDFVAACATVNRLFLVATAEPKKLIADK